MASILTLKIIKMKKLSLLLAILFSLTLSIGCGSKEKKSKDGYVADFTPMEVVIPDELKDNPEAVEYIQNMSKAVDAYALALDKMAREVHKMGIKEGEEPTTMQKLKLVKIVATHFQDIAQTAEPMYKYFEQSYFLQEDYTDEQLAAFATVMDRFQARMDEMSKKYESLSQVASME